MQITSFLINNKRKALLIIGIVSILIIFYFFFFKAPNNFPTQTVFNIKEGSSLRSISKELVEQKIIRSRVVFETLVIFFGGEKKIYFGDYFLDKKLSIWQVAGRIARGEKNLAPIKITIPEGFDLKDMAEIFSLKLNNFDKNNFFEEAQEGYLFPDTYFFLTTDTEKEVIHSMQNNFQKKLQTVQSILATSKMKQEEIIILASLIEKESNGDEDRAFISGILWKRLSLNMPLQVDAAPETYKTRGLPTKPICSPGLKAIEAALKPKDSPYLYYLHDSEGNIHYARDFNEHKLNKQKYLKN